jgi:hypothetical protein
MELFNPIYSEYLGPFAPMAVGDKIPGTFAEHQMVRVYGAGGYFIPTDGVVFKVNLFFVKDSFV